MTLASSSPLPSGESRTEPGCGGKEGAAQPQFRLRKVLWVVVPAALVAVAAVPLFGLVDVGALVGDLTRPTIVRVQGKIAFQGEPLKKAQLMTHPVGRRGVAAIGWTDAEGNLEMKTDIRGVRMDGMTVGEHVVTVRAFGSSPGASAPPLLTPASYATMSTTPLRITVTRDPKKNIFHLDLQGEPASRPRPVAEGKQRVGKQPRPKGVQEPSPADATSPEDDAKPAKD